MADLTSEQIRNLEQIRQRLLSLNASLGALRKDLAGQLPSWSSLQGHANLISSNLQQINSSLTDHSDLLASTIAFPSLQYPGRQQSDVMQMLLRTKLEPDVEEWVEKGQSLAKDANMTTQMLGDKERAELWHWAPGAANSLARKQKWGADYTLAEVQSGIEHVVTGLKRELVEPPPDEDTDDEDDFFGDDDEDEDDEEAGSMDIDTQSSAVGASHQTAPKTGQQESTQMPMESVHRFMITGKVG